MTLGADVVNGALKVFRDKYAGTDAPPATSRALYAELQAVTPDSLRPLLSDLFEHITLWDVRTDSVRAEPDGAGAWRTTLFVDASKVRADSIGQQTPIPMDDLVEIGVFAGATAGSGGPGEALYLQQHRIRSGKQTITVTVPRKPASAGIDPYRKFIQRERDDNVKGVEGYSVRRGFPGWNRTGAICSSAEGDGVGRCGPSVGRTGNSSIISATGTMP